MRRRLHRVDERLPTPLASEASEFVRADDDHFLAAVDSDVLGAVGLCATDQLAEPRLRILQAPGPRAPPSPPPPTASRQG